MPTGGPAFRAGLWLSVLLAAALSTSGNLAAGEGPIAQLQELQRQLQAQQQQIEELESRLGQPTGDIKRLPEPANAAIVEVNEPIEANGSEPAEETQPDSSDEADQSEMEADLTSLTGRVSELEEYAKDARGTERKFQEALSEVSSRVVNGRLHIDQWMFPASSEGINIIETGSPVEDPLNELIFRRVRFGIHGQVPPENMSYRIELEFSGQDGGRIRDAWLGWDDLLIFDTIRLGNQKRPYGLDHLNSSNFMVFIDRPFVVDALNENNRRFGLMSYGLSDDLTYNWHYGVCGLELVQNSGQSFVERLQPEVTGRLSSTWWYDESSLGRGYGHWGISFACAFPDGDAPNDGRSNNLARFRTPPEAPTQNRWLNTGRIAGAEAYQILGLESVFNVGRVQVTGEFMNLWLQRRADAGRDIFLHGGYVYVSYFLTGEHLPWNRELGILGRLQPLEDFFLVPTCWGDVGRGIGAWQVALRLSYADLSDADVLGGVGQSATLAVNWYWNSHSRVQANYSFGRIDDRLTQLDNGSSVVVAGDYQTAGVRFMMDF